MTSRENTRKLACAVNKYYSRPYRDEDHSSSWIVNGKKIIVNRPNHGLAHGIRQGLLAVRLCRLLVSDFEYTGFGNKLRKWLQKQYNRDKFFLQKVECVAAFMRTGRESEIASTENPKLYREYERNSCQHFIEYAKLQNIYACNEEICNWSQCIPWEDSNNKDIRYIQRILRAAHLLDLRRINRFNIARIKSNVYKELFASTENLGMKIIETMWKQEGLYLEASGDRDVVSQKGYSNKFAVLSSNPEQLVDALYDV